MAVNHLKRKAAEALDKFESEQELNAQCGMKAADMESEIARHASEMLRSALYCLGRLP